MTLQGRIYDQGGSAAGINSYLEGEEYLAAYGETIVPYTRGYTTQPGQTVTAFTHWFQLSRGAASSDRGLHPQNRAQLNRFVMGNTPSSAAPVSGVFTSLVVSIPFPNQGTFSLPPSCPPLPSVLFILLREF